MARKVYSPLAGLRKRIKASKLGILLSMNVYLSWDIIKLELFILEYNYTVQDIERELKRNAIN
jgi:hypothetical protein